MARKNRPGKTDPDPEEVLQGRRSLTLDEMIRLIHRVNPTGERLPPAEAANRYRQKALLQSLMIQKFPDHLTVDRPDPAHPDLIGLRRTGFFDDDACHALIGELDPEAQDWVGRRFDQVARDDEGVRPPGRAPRPTPAPRPHATPAPAAGTSTSMPSDGRVADPHQALELGRQALDAFDFETCETCGRAALSAAGSDPAPALLLLELFVDHLADHDQALAVGESLPPEVAGDPRVTAFLVLAETRAGRAADALARARRAGQPAPAEVLVAAGQAFLRQGDLDRATQVLRELDEREDRPDLDPADWREEREALRHSLREAAADRLAPLEQPVRQALAEGRLPEALALAEALLAAYPGNQVATRTIREIKARQRQERLQSHLDAADAARLQDDPGREADCLRRAIAAGAAPDPLRTRLEAAQAADRERQAAEMTRRVAGLLTTPPGTAGLRQYLDLAEPLRRRLREQTADPRLPWLERLAFPRPAARPDALVEAVQALAEANRTLSGDAPPERILALLAPQADVLQGLPEARELSRRAAARQQELRAAHAREFLAAAARHLEEGRLAEARTALDRLDRDTAALLPDPDQEHLETVRRRAETQEAWARLANRYAAARDRGDHFAARRLAEELAAAGDPAHTDRWKALAADHEAALAKAWCLAEAPCQELPPFFDSLGLGEGILDEPAVLLPDGKTVVVGTTHGQWLFLRLFSTAAQACRRVIVLRAPCPIELIGLTFGGGSLWVKGERGELLEITLSPPAIRSWMSASTFVPDQDIVEEVFLLPEERLIWIDHRRRGPEFHHILEIMDLDCRKASRRVPVAGILKPLVSSQGTIFAVDRFPEGGMMLFSATGKPVASFPFPRETAIHAATVHPNGHDFIFLTHSDEDSPPILSLEIRPPADPPVPPFPIEGSDGDMEHEAFTSFDTGLVYVLMCISDDQDLKRELAAFRLAGVRWVEVFRCEVPNEFLLLPEPGSRGVMAVSWVGGRLQAVTLSSAPHVLAGDRPSVTVPRMPPLRGEHLSCGFRSEHPGRVQHFLDSLAPLGRPKILDMIQDMKTPDRHPPEEILAFRDALDSLSLFDEADALADWLGKAHAGHRVGRLLAAARAAKAGDWETTRRLLEDLPRPAGARNNRHQCHLLGIALYHAGRFAEAAAVWKEGEEQHPDGYCHLRPYLEFAAQGLTATDPASRDRWPGAAIQARFAAAIDGGNWAEACSILWERPASDFRNGQLLARLATALLAQTFPPGSLDDLLKIVALAFFQEVLRDTSSTREVALHSSVENWPPERIAAIDTQAGRWLDARAAPR
ncbi:MAG: hypothetical protein GX442_19410 [Candidatus Riflebacteria bacterium]|nr:hypothetical protein [Candidatus Riflebacteria bacterium]